MVTTWLQVLTDGNHVNVMCSQITHHFDDLVIGFATAHHQAGFGPHFRSQCLVALEQIQ